MMSDPNNEAFLIGFGDEAEEKLAKAFQSSRIITAPFGDDAGSRDDWLGVDESVIFAVKEVFDSDAAGVVVSRQDRTVPMNIMRSGLSFKALDYPISPIILSIGTALYQERLLRWDMEDVDDRLRRLLRELLNPVNGNEGLTVLANRSMSAQGELAKAHADLIEGLHAYVKASLMSPSDVF